MTSYIANDEYGTDVPQGGAPFARKELHARGAVTQITTINTGVTLHKLWGEITTVSQTVAGAAEFNIVVTNNMVSRSDVVLVCLRSANGGAGVFMLAVTNVTDGAFTITGTNVDAAAGNSVLNISFVVIKNPYR